MIDAATYVYVKEYPQRFEYAAPSLLRMFGWDLLLHNEGWVPVRAVYPFGLGPKNVVKRGVVRHAVRSFYTGTCDASAW